jgi:predicted small lipoprotein YifL
MKNILKFSILLFLLTTLNSCGPKLPKGQKVVELPCFQDKYTSAKKDYVASGRGISVDQVISRKKAMMNAKSEIASLIKSNIRSLTDDYAISRTVGNKEEFKSRFETITSETVNEMLTDIKVACQELAFDKNSGQYNTYIALSISKDRTAAQVIQKLSSKEKKELDIDYEKFRTLLDKDVPTNN